ncbi:TKL protein kinase [Saprolegnia parasitica CBS 223.65]|uniref:TKL protein kinase n=1 Tax=Saprolegnia parasitica (strain CBS 223.65) TaxID=695850 RepID=A0A067BTP9_SAPPC|nr:TKL protein kinase [Saprolegnia parasitica CBS 223.65]KDO20170.1 TKL protein kinase [Saprolegnia parasitica CBS 223.65]|eukprot:XP_012209119.1 TKL protein kinase [Saprolegnia parasitica CBS 223.65]
MGEDAKAVALVDAVHAGDTTRVAALLRGHADANARNQLGELPLFEAVRRGRHDMVRLLLDAGAKPDLPSRTGATALLAAADAGDVDLVRQLVRARANVNFRHSSGVTAIILATQRGSEDSVVVLINAGADVRSRTWAGVTPILAAAEQGNVAIARRLLDAGANILDVDQDCYGVLHYAAKEGHVEMLDVLVASGAAVDAVSVTGATPLHCACVMGHALVVDALLTETYPYADETGATPLCEAAANGHTEVARELVRAGAMMLERAKVAARSLAKLQEVGIGCYSIVFKDTHCGQDVAVKVYRKAHLSTAIIRDKIQVLKDNPSPYIVRLLATADAESDAPQLIFEYMDGGNLTSYLEKLALGKYVPVVYDPIEILWVVANALNDLHAKNVVHRDINTDNILLSSKYYIKVADLGAAKKESTNMTTGAGTSKWRAPEVLTSGSGYGKAADIYSFGILLQTLYPNPLHASAEWAQALAADCTAIDPTHRPTATKLVEILQLQMRHSQLVVSLPAFLHDQKVGPPAIDVIPINPTVVARKLGPSPSTLKTGETGLIIATCLGHCDIVSVLLARGANVNAAQIFGHTPLHLAIKKNNKEALDVLLRANANVNAVTNKKNTPLHYATKSRLDAVVALLIAHGADVNGRNNDNESALQVACRIRFVAAVPILLTHGADVNTKHNGLSPLWDAIMSNCSDLAAALLTSSEININEQDELGNSLLHLAVMKHNTTIARLLVGAKVDVDVVDAETKPCTSSCFRRPTTYTIFVLIRILNLTSL